MKIAIFYHCLFFSGEPPELLPVSLQIARDQMEQIKGSGLRDAAQELHVGINGGGESLEMSRLVIPAGAKIQLHGLESRNENSTLRMIEEWLPGHSDWLVLYFHCKGATHPVGDPMRTVWRNCMMRTIRNWRQSVSDLQNGYDSVGVHWMTGADTPPGQSVWAGNFWWARADFLLSLPSIMQRDRIKVSGLKHLDSRYESEVWIGNGPRLPRIKDYHGPHWNPSKWQSCNF